VGQAVHRPDGAVIYEFGEEFPQFLVNSDLSDLAGGYRPGFLWKGLAIAGFARQFYRS
jgi:hypothetical protein